MFEFCNRYFILFFLKPYQTSSIFFPWVQVSRVKRIKNINNAGNTIIKEEYVYQYLYIILYERFIINC